MNRVLYQLSYAALSNSLKGKFSFVIIPTIQDFVKRKVMFFKTIFGNTLHEVTVMQLQKKGFLFFIGGLGYVLVELLWRGYSHISMFFAGGICFLLLGQLSGRRLPPAAKALLGSAMITGVELSIGLLVNRDFSVWDYRTMPHSFMGQICLPFSLLWIPLSLLGIGLYRSIEKRLPG